MMTWARPAHGTPPSGGVLLYLAAHAIACRFTPCRLGDTTGALARLSENGTPRHSAVRSVHKLQENARDIRSATSEWIENEHSGWHWARARQSVPAYWRAAAAWRHARDEEPPLAVEDDDMTWPGILAWAAFSGFCVAFARVVGRGVAREGWRQALGRNPPTP